MNRSNSLTLFAKDKKHKKGKLQDRTRDAGLTENQAAVDQYNKRIKRQGVFGDQWRRF